MLSTIQKKHTRFKQSSPYKTQACLFSQALQQETQKNPHPSEEALGEYCSRVQRMKAEFNNKRKAG